MQAADCRQPTSETVHCMALMQLARGAGLASRSPALATVGPICIRDIRVLQRQSVACYSQAAPDVKQLAKMAQIGLSDAEAADAEPKIKSILEWFGQLQAIDTAGVVPAIHATEQGTALRDDTPQTYDARSELLAQAPATQGSYVRVPKIATAADAAAAPAAGAASTSTKAAGAAASASAPAAKQPAAAAAPAESTSTSSSGAGDASAQELEALRVLDFRVGKIVECKQHPDADSLYVEQIDIGEPSGPRTIVSGLVKYVPLEEMQGRMVVVVANLKPRNMRGIKSAGMVLAASDDPKTRVVPIIPPEGAQIGERVWFGEEKEQPAPAVPNAVEKKRLWEVAAPGLRTNAQGVATWRGRAMQTSAGAVSAPTLPESRIA